MVAAIAMFANSAAAIAVEAQTTPDAVTAVLAGHVTQEDGKPVAQAIVSLLGIGDSAITADDGAFSLRAPPGAYVIGVRRLGFRLERFTVTLAPGEIRDVTVIASRAVPILARVTTTAEERAAYRSVGFEQRMKAGIGQYLTYDQIIRKHAPEFSDLLRGFRGIRVWRNSSNPAMQFGQIVEGTRGAGSCVSFVVDGVPQTVLNSRDADRIVDLSSVAAVEVYSSAERPPEFGSLEERPLEVGNPASDPVDPDQRVRVDQQCVLVVVWTLGRLGLPNKPSEPADTQIGNVGAPVDATRGLAGVESQSACKLGAPRDTADLVIYGSLQGFAPSAIPDSTWARYKHDVLVAFGSFFALPTDLTLPAFGVPELTIRRQKRGATSREEVEVGPTLSNVIGFTLNARGELTSARVIVSSLSGSADTSVLAAVERTATAHGFPPLPSVEHGEDSARLYVVVASIEPTAAIQAAVLGQLEVPMWPLRRAAQFVSSRTPANSYDNDSVTVEAVVDQTGRMVAGTLRTIGKSPASEALDLIDGVRFNPALVGTCPVPELILQSLPIARRSGR